MTRPEESVPPHAEEPWVAIPSSNSVGVYGPLRGGCREEMARCCSWDRRERAQRIAACVNACRGIPTEDLERDDFLIAVQTRLAQRAELLAACKAILHALDCREATDPTHRDYRNPVILAADRHNAERLVRAAVAKAEGRTA